MTDLNANAELRDAVIAGQRNRCLACNNRHDSSDLKLTLTVPEHRGGAVDAVNAFALCPSCHRMMAAVHQDIDDMNIAVQRAAAQQNHICARCHLPQDPGAFHPATTKVQANGRSVKVGPADVDQALCELCHYANGCCDSCRHNPDLNDQLKADIAGAITRNRTSASIAHGYALGLCNSCVQPEPLPATIP